MIGYRDTSLCLGKTLCRSCWTLGAAGTATAGWRGLDVRVRDRPHRQTIADGAGCVPFPEAGRNNKGRQANNGGLGDAPVPDTSSGIPSGQEFQFKHR
jgi:hypothetical protein